MSTVRVRAAMTHDASVEPGTGLSPCLVNTLIKLSTEAGDDHGAYRGACSAVPSRAGRPTVHLLFGRVIPDFVCEGIDLGEHLSRLTLDVD